MKIKLLDEVVSRCIAAGEVVESPACVVKELIENSIDAGATSIFVDVRGGGFDLIRVSDDGIGMSQDECSLCFARHATSKLTTVHDLDVLQSFGFRGEALAAIAAVSQVRLLSSNDADETEVIIDGGSTVSMNKASRDQGTTFEVRNLFFNVPARKRFQKSKRRTASMMTKVFCELALAYPSIRFFLQRDQEEHIALASPTSFQDVSGYLDRVRIVLGEQFASRLVPFQAKSSHASLIGFITSPEHSFPYKTSQYFFLNRRAIQSAILSQSVSKACQYWLPEGRVPGALLFLTMDGKHVDVNVHPRKREVRFQDEIAVRQFVQESIVSQLVGEGFKTSDVVLTESSVSKKSLPWESEPVFSKSPAVFEPLNAQDRPTFIAIEPKIMTTTQECSGLFVEGKTANEISVQIPKSPGSSSFSKQSLLAILRTYALLDVAHCPLFRDGEQEKNWDGIWVDCLRASMHLHSRNYFSECTQGLLTPLQIEFPECLIPALENKCDVLDRMGFGLSRAGVTQVSVHRVPSAWSKKEIDTFLEQLPLRLEQKDLFSFSHLRLLHLRKGIKFSYAQVLCILEELFSLYAQQPELIAACCYRFSLEELICNG